METGVVCNWGGGGAGGLQVGGLNKQDVINLIRDSICSKYHSAETFATFSAGAGYRRRLHNDNKCRAPDIVLRDE